jgi:hypothetical protein
MLEGLGGVLRPIARLLLLCGIGYAEFAATAKAAFVQVASDDYGIRGRPTNASRIAAMTGLSRKEVSRIRDDAAPTHWSPAIQTTPLSTLLHHWYFDPDFSDLPGKPKALSLEGDLSFATLVRRYAGDIPPGAMKTELCRAGAVIEVGTDRLAAVKRYPTATSFDADYVHKLAYSLRNLASTSAHNAIARSAGAQSVPVRQGRFERYARTDRLAPESIGNFDDWVHSEGTEFLEKADHWLGTHEIAHTAWGSAAQRDIGVGVYFFIED